MPGLFFMTHEGKTKNRKDKVTKICHSLIRSISLMKPDEKLKKHPPSPPPPKKATV